MALTVNVVADTPEPHLKALFEMPQAPLEELKVKPLPVIHKCQISFTTGHLAPHSPIDKETTSTREHTRRRRFVGGAGSRRVPRAGRDQTAVLATAGVGVQVCKESRVSCLP